MKTLQEAFEDTYDTIQKVFHIQASTELLRQTEIKIVEAQLKKNGRQRQSKMKNPTDDSRKKKQSAKVPICCKEGNN